jgi:predicted mannosyl-3-phosphoglycerate phosphatase (HAD superfamily)
MCSFCRAGEETIYHLLWDCPIVQQLLSEFVNLCNSKSIFLELNAKTFILGELNKSDLAKSFNVILMSMKFYIYKMKCLENSLSIQGLLDTTRLLSESNSVIYNEMHGENSENSENIVTLSSKHSLLMQMNSKLSDVELKNTSLETRLAEVEKQNRQ